VCSKPIEYLLFFQEDMDDHKIFIIGIFIYVKCVCVFNYYFLMRFASIFL